MATQHDDRYTVPTHDGDHAAWAHHQAMLLRAGQLHLIDKPWIAEELEDLGRSEFRQLESALRLVLSHLLKWDHQPERRSRSWTASIGTRRRQVLAQLEDSPSLKVRLPVAIAAAYDDARREASAETDLPLKIFPETCPYDRVSMMARPVAMPGDD